MTKQVQSKKLTWKSISQIEAMEKVEFYTKESTVLDWEISQAKKGKANLMILVELPPKL